MPRRWAKSGSSDDRLHPSIPIYTAHEPYRAAEPTRPRERFLQTRAPDLGATEHATDYAISPMRLTDYTDYSLRVMLYLAVRPEGLTTIQEISDAYGISKNHLMKVVQRLGELGWVETVRGRNGGLRLDARTPLLSIGEVVRETENDFSIVGCFAGENEAHGHCVIQSHCRMRGVFAAARDAFLAELDRHTIGDLASPANELAGLLGIVRFMPPASMANRMAGQG